MEILFLTGMSGAGKSAAVRYLEDCGYFCMDNVPPYVLPDLVKSFFRGRNGEGFSTPKLAFVVDVRSQEYLDGFDEALALIDEEVGCPYKVIFLEASDPVLISRYQQSRRKHPLAKKKGSLTQALAEERKMLENIREIATVVVDTSLLTDAELCKAIGEIIKSEDGQNILVVVESFGFKYGLPVDCDYIFDVRFLPNPFYLPQLRNFTGKDPEIAKYLEGFRETDEFNYMTSEILSFVIPFYEKEGKGSVHIGIGCTGGRHRSVYCAETIARKIAENGIKCIVNHRDVEKEPHRYTKKADES
ncbi:MAG: RNase adapter RapZ [Clostridiales bacterium]|nr:RNase adapter RapZ [Clostridiales bacterium]